MATLSASEGKRSSPVLTRTLEGEGFRDGLWFVGIVLASMVFLLFQIGVPAKHVYDEFHYIPAAQEVLATITNRNYEHPPLGKFLIAAGLALFGDNPIGWRFMSVLFGSLTLGSIFLWARALFSERRAALFTVALSVVDHHVFVMSRIGMLDGFMVAFLAAGVAAWAWAERAEFDSRRRTALMALAGALLGLSTACKWVGVLALGWVGLMALLAGEWRRPIRLAATLAVAPAIFYFSTFLPFFFAPDGPNFSFAGLWAMQTRMLDGQLHVVSSHPYNAAWWGWPLMLRPMWFAFEREPDPEYIRGVFMVGNPLLMWGGLVFLFLTFLQWLKKGSGIARHIVLGYAFLYFSWIIIPRKIAFYYYYYPAALLLGFAVTAVFFDLRQNPDEQARALWARRETLWLALCSAVFIWFYPILAGLRIPGETFHLWAWFRSWI